MHKSNSSLARAPFAEQLTELISMELPDWAQIPTASTREAVEQVDDASNQVLAYFATGRSVLNGLDAQDDVEWMFEGRQAVLDVGKTIMRAGDVMNHLMTVLEGSRGSDDKADQELDELYLPIVEKIERAITEWHDILGLVRDLRSQIDIATEWKEFYDQIMTEVQQEIDSCFTVIFEIEEKRHFASVERPDLDVLASVMDESPFLGHPKLPNMNDVERELNHKFIEVKTRIKPLRASLEFIPLRLEQYSCKAKSMFPASIEALYNKYKEMHTRWNALNSDINTLEKELGEDRWLAIFRNTGVQAEEMLDNYDDNKSMIDVEMTKQVPDQQVLERYQTQNAYLVPAISRIVALFDRALKDRLTVNGEMYNTQSKLHSRWAQLEPPAVHHQDSPSLTSSNGKFDDGSSSGGSNRSSFSSTTSPYSSMHSSPTLSSVKPINTKLKPGRQSRTSLEGCVEINPLRGLGRPNSLSSNSSASSSASISTVKDNRPTHSSRLSLLPVPRESPRPMHHVRPPSIPELVSSTPEPTKRRRSSMIPRPASARQCHHTPFTPLHGLDTPRSMTPRPRTSSRLDDESSLLPRPRSRLGDMSTTPRRSVSKLETPISRKTSMPGSLNRMSSMATLRRQSVYQTPSRKTSTPHLLTQTRQRPGTAIGSYAYGRRF